MNTVLANPRPVVQLSCALWGHVVNNDVFRRMTGPRRRCRCGTSYLAEDGSLTHVRHTLSCFLQHHTYVRLADRDGVHEYVCVRCGHPLVFPAEHDRFAERDRFTKKVRYACGFFGHRVKAVATRDGFVEYACNCGHSFLRESGQEQTNRHPLN
jgi:DNA-directed RNA polymerase subunit RPC12/RpoP